MWGKGIALTDRVVYTHVNKLRGKIERDPSAPEIVLGVRGWLLKNLLPPAKPGAAAPKAPMPPKK